MYSPLINCVGRTSRGTAVRTQFQSDLQSQRRQKQIENLEKDDYGHEEKQASADEGSGSEGMDDKAPILTTRRS